MTTTPEIQIIPAHHEGRTGTPVRYGWHLIIDEEWADWYRTKAEAKKGAALCIAELANPTPKGDAVSDTDAYGYDGTAISIGDRIELHPALDLWMRGARYGTVTSLSLTPNDRVRFTLDAFPNHQTPFAASADSLRRV